MKIIEAMRKIKVNLEKVEETQKLIKQYCADLEIQEPTYPDQAGRISSWLTSIHDLLEEVETLKERISATNLATSVTVELGTLRITKTITKWISRRDTLAKLELSSWEALTDRGLQTTPIKDMSTGELRLVKVRRYFDSKVRDEKAALFRSEPHLIDGALEVANATTELI